MGECTTFITFTLLSSALSLPLSWSRTQIIHTYKYVFLENVLSVEYYSMYYNLKTCPTLCVCFCILIYDCGCVSWALRHCLDHINQLAHLIKIQKHNPFYCRLIGLRMLSLPYQRDKEINRENQ